MRSTVVSFPIVVLAVAALGYTTHAADSVVRPWNCLSISLAGSLSSVQPAPGCVAVASADLARLGSSVTAIKPPAAPVRLTASLVGDSTVLLSWTAASAGGAPTSYMLQAGTASGTTNLANANTGSALPTLTITGVPNGTYYFRVLAQNASGTSAASNDVRVGIGAPACAPGTPTGLAASVNGFDVTLNWQAPSAGACPAAAYTIQAGSAPGLSNLASFSTGSAATSYSASGVPTGLYYVRVLAGNGGTTGAASNEVTVPVNTCPGPPGQVTGLVATVFGSTVSLTWNAPSGQSTGYFIQAGSAPGASNLGVIGTGGGYYIAEGVPAGTYYIRVFARNNCGAGAVSNEVTAAVGSGPTAPRVTVTAMHGFLGSPSDGSNLSTIIQGRDGNFYGTTVTGGPFSSNCNTNLNGCGTAFRMTPGGALTILHNFGSDGAPPYPLYPYSQMVEASDGNFYGTLTEGTPVPGRLAGGAVVFRITPVGAVTRMADLGGASYGRLIQGTDGNIYGTTGVGGTGADVAGFTGNGAVFRMTLGGSLTYLHAFTGGSDGKNSYGGLIQGRDGNFYGMTALGGANNGGTIFRISSSGAFAVLHTFDGGAGGGRPYGPLMQGSDGNFYGTTQFGGGNLSHCVSEGCGAGVAFKITPSGAYTVLHAFTGSLTPDLTSPSRTASDGYRPAGGLLQASNGNFYGTTAGGGAHGGGTTFVIMADESYSQIFTFAGNAEGSSPTHTLIEGTDGNLYGTCQYGGAANKGAIFRMTIR